VRSGIWGGSVSIVGYSPGPLVVISRTVHSAITMLCSLVA
jgi:hypothetical protein